jgi:hypothetical protein
MSPIQVQPRGISPELKLALEVHFEEAGADLLTILLSTGIDRLRRRFELPFDATQMILFYVRDAAGQPVQTRQMKKLQQACENLFGATEPASCRSRHQKAWVDLQRLLRLELIDVFPLVANNHIVGLILTTRPEAEVRRQQDFHLFRNSLYEAVENRPAGPIRDLKDLSLRGYEWLQINLWKAIEREMIVP